MKRLIMDIDNTILNTIDRDYENAVPIEEVINKVREYKQKGFDIVFYTSRNMQTHSNNLGLINAHTIPVILEWLNKHNVPFDELFVGKPWCGNDGFYVDDKAIRPSEFAKLSYNEIKDLIDYEVSG